MTRLNAMLVLFLGALSSDLAIAEDISKCRAIPFTEPGHGASTVVVDRVEGQAVFAPVGMQREIGGAGGVCVVLFDKQSQKQAAVTTTGEVGEFSLTVDSGDYVLIVANPALGSIVEHLRLSSSAQPPNRLQGLLLRLRNKEDTRRSFVSAIGNLPVRKELLEMQKVDQAIRHEWLRGGANLAEPALTSRMAEIDLKNTKRLQTIVDEIGWPEVQLVAMDGANAAWLILQHAAYETQKKMFPLIEKAYRAGEVEGQNYALLLDRILVREGKPQIYGSQAKPFEEWHGNEPVLEPLEDEAGVDARRAAVGLPPLADYREVLKRMRSEAK